MIINGCNNRLVGLMRLPNKEMTGLLFGTQQSGRNNKVVVLRRGHMLGCC